MENKMFNPKRNSYFSPFRIHVIHRRADKNMYNRIILRLLNKFCINIKKITSPCLVRLFFTQKTKSNIWERWSWKIANKNNTNLKKINAVRQHRERWRVITEFLGSSWKVHSLFPSYTTTIILLEPSVYRLMNYMLSWYIVNFSAWHRV